MKYKIHVIPHMHWDREWYFTTEESRILLVNNMEEILNRLETDEAYKYYTLDGQTAILEDYLSVKPENKGRLKKLVQQGKLIIGPFYTQSDERVVGGESLVRNLLYGIKDCREFLDENSTHMNIGYLPDSFGQTAQLPQILNGFNINYTIFWRGCSQRHGTDKTEFVWQSSSGDSVIAQILPLGYAIGKYLPLEEEALKKRMDKYFSVLKPQATTEHICFPHGHDQMPLQENIFDVIKVLEKLYPEDDFFISNYSLLMNEIAKNQANLPILKGEFLDPKYMRVHRTISSTRADLKIANTVIENKLTNILEPLATIAYSLGFEYHHGLLEQIWKEIMKNHAHDSMGCCCSDAVHEEIKYRFMLGLDKTNNLINFYMRKIADNMDYKNQDTLVLYNTLSAQRSEVVRAKITTRLVGFSLVDKGKTIKYSILKKTELDPGLIDRQIVHYGNYEPFFEYEVEFMAENIPAFGYKTYEIVASTESVSLKDSSAHHLENNFYKITLNKNGTINILDKNSGSMYENVLVIEDASDDGDSYDYSPIENDFIVGNENISGLSAHFTMNELSQELEVSYNLKTSQNLEERAAGVATANIPITIKITLNNNSDTLDLKVNINNTAIDHRMRLLIPNNLASNFSIADNQFGSIKRHIIDEAINVWEAENWEEKPIPVYSMLSFVGLDNAAGLAVLTAGVREYEIIEWQDKPTIAITLFRSIGVLGKENLINRPHRPSGIKLETPNSQLLTNLEFNLGLVAYKDGILEEGIPARAKTYTTPIITYNKTNYNAMKLNPVKFTVPQEFSLLESSGEGILSTMKKCEDSKNILLRLYNPLLDKNIKQFIQAKDIAIEKSYTAKLNEEIIDERNGDLEIKPTQVQSLVLKIKR
ncbi:MAG: mannosylglycerate hydrolase [Alphaproteobacteria bacterium]|jgi:mannosylglycerate hydrolase|nr:mannosylglycerate hydrolase [Alphaproteobacteria bacterium]